MTGQISLIDYINDRDNITFGGCGQCVCRSCLYWWSGRCPYGGCWDKHRAEIDPYDKAHPDEPPRTTWSYWDEDCEFEQCDMWSDCAQCIYGPQCFPEQKDVDY